MDKSEIIRKLKVCFDGMTLNATSVRAAAGNLIEVIEAISGEKWDGSKWTNSALIKTTRRR